jgi:hypothetical protein
VNGTAYSDFLASKRIVAEQLDPVFIYALVDPETDQVRYVGKSIRPFQRLQNHMNEKSNCHRSHWLQSLKRKGLIPRVVILEIVEGAWPWQESERYWIATLKAMDARLTNNTRGGDGVTGLPGETRAKMRSTWVGRRHRPESLLKIGAASQGRKHDEQWKRLMHEKMKNRQFSVEHRARLAVAVSKFSKEQAEIIRQRLVCGERVRDLAKEFNVHRTTISKIKAGQYQPTLRAGVRQ